ncbi:uncharacterized protein A1O9_05026 [Exophiala aquamarina CBS 119918]|uniref:Uncharacterized protein n=1 Tax=Exophiala aquamarina CBS 119918 TaxID=1182545 RepID=A0A072PJW4_9EURO|nr:uncharacterized protein A1O9_05026 [Exophiala aquamarina CBS 119918]KEF60176.1 hypothetical protein A1O9_05026 [Exophiala aquamarina CBS 119918]
MQGSSKSSRAILHSLISASAFHLRGHKTERDTSWHMYDEIGRLNRLQALKLLQEDLIEQPKDAEAIYMTMSASLTLVTADIVEGDCTEFLTHLQACHQLRALHEAQRRSMEAYTPRMRQLDIAGLFLTTLAQTTAHHLPEVWQFSLFTTNTPIFNSPFTEVDSCLEFTYGITSSIASAIYYTNQIWYYATSTSATSTDLIIKIFDAILDLADMLDCWTPSAEPFASIGPGKPGTLSLVQNLAISFHSATQIYFQSCFDLASISPTRSSLTHLSRCTLLALERAESDKARLSKAGASFGWPAFVAACEAPEELRPRWALYFQKLLTSRIGSMQRAWNVVEEVWRRMDTVPARGATERRSRIMRVESTPIRILEPVWAAVLREGSMTLIAA